MERAKAEARRNAPDLPIKDVAEATTETSNQDAAVAASDKDPYARIRETKEGSAERVKAFMELPDGEHELGGKKFTKQGNTFQRDGQQLSSKGIEKSFRDADISLSRKNEPHDTPATHDTPDKTAKKNR